ncbi:MAG: hypothetical protein HRU19_02050 [Pseudobacteriovorax sp.]|nr:hypothetical protein [Pseudobacteriovorax sp.]
MHPGLASHGDNYLGRAVFDFENNNQLRYIQIFHHRNSRDGSGPRIYFDMPQNAPRSNFDWNRGSSSFYASFE